MKKALLPLLFLIVAVSNKAQPLITFQTVTTGLSQPVDLAEANDGLDQLFIVERTGKIRIWRNNRLLPTAFLDATSVINASGSEQGLLSVAFHPEYKNNGYFFIYYTDTSGAITVARYSKVNDSVANPSSGVVLLNIAKNSGNHNGGDLSFGSDGFLYFATGDGGGSNDPDNNAQNPQSLLGKMLRIDVNNPVVPYYTVPSTNPFFGSTTTREEIIATGLRNPWRWSFDKQTGDMWIADVGQNAWEEVNMVPTSNLLDKDYGWSCIEGTHTTSKGCAAKANNVVPIFEYPHNNTSGGYSITGGYVYRGTEYPGLQGYYICSDYVSRNGWLIKPNGSGGWNTIMQTGWPNLSSFAESINGTLYALSLNGTMYKVVQSNALPVGIVSFTGVKTGNNLELLWQVHNETAGDIYIIEKRTGSTEVFTEISRTKAAISRSLNSYTVKVPLGEGQTYYRLKTISAQGQTYYSSIISYNKFSKTIKATVSGTNLNVTLPAGTTMIEIFDASGRMLKRQKINTGERQIMIPLTKVAKGIISIRAIVENERQSIQVAF